MKKYSRVSLRGASKARRSNLRSARRLLRPLWGLAMTVVFLFTYTAFAFASDPVNVSSLKKLPIQYNGRVQPLESLAIDLAETVHGRKTVLGHSSLSFLLELLAKPDVWYQKPIVKIGFLPFKRQAGLDTTRNYYSLNELETSVGVQKLFDEVVAKSERGEDLLPVDRKIQSARNAFLMANALLTGDILKIAPPPGRPSLGQAAPAPGTGEDWLSVRELAERPDEKNAAILEFLRQVMDSYAKNDQAAFDQAVNQLETALREINPNAWNAGWKLDLEIMYHAFQPFRWAWVFYLVSGLLFIFGWRLEKNSLRRIGTGAFVIAFLCHTAGLVLRILVLSRPPVSNMYESVVFMSWMVSVFALVLAGVLKRMLLINVSAFVGAAILILGSLMPFDPSLDVLVPVLRSNYWLTIHVLTIVSSYGAFALAMGVAHVALGHFIRESTPRAPRSHAKIKDLTHLVYRSIQVGVILLAAGTILGGVWANESWGRFWGWDPKETWALISLLGYLALLHARFIGWVKDFGLSVGAVLCFMLIVMTWYGVNFVLGRGLHSYGFGAGGGQWVTLFLVAEFIYLFLAWRKVSRPSVRV